MDKLKLGIIYGGMSTEHNISVLSAKSILENLNKDKYEIFPIYIDSEGQWHRKMNDGNEEVIENIISHLKNLNVVFPVLHGKFGEDGTVQGLLELLKIPYVGCGIFSSSVSLDKVYTKILFEKANIKQAKYEFIKKINEKYFYIDKNFNEIEKSLDDICKIIENKISYPMFVKPSNSGSSVGINKAHNLKELKTYINYASRFDTKVLVEKTIIGKEVECAILGNERIQASTLGEIKPAEEFYSFDSKYNNNDSKLIIPSSINKELVNRVKKIAIKAFKIIGGKGLARIDFFVNDKADEIYINEINTMPGFTTISMYPKLWEYDGIQYEQLLDKLVDLALER